MTAAPPEAGEYPESVQKFIDLSPTGDILRTLSIQGIETVEYLRSLGEDRGWERPAEDRWSLRELVGHMLEEKSLYDRLFTNAVLLATASLVTSEDEKDEESEVYLGGTTRIMQKPELADIDRMIHLFQTFEEKGRLVKIINECLKTRSSTPSVRIGLGQDIPGMRDWALVSSPYLHNQKVIGGVSKFRKRPEIAVSNAAKNNKVEFWPADKFLRYGLNSPKVIKSLHDMAK